MDDTWTPDEKRRYKAGKPGLHAEQPTEPKGDHRVVIAVRTKAEADRLYDFVRNELDNAKIGGIITQQSAAIVKRERASGDLMDALDSVVGVLGDTIPAELLAECKAALASAKGVK